MDQISYYLWEPAVIARIFREFNWAFENGSKARTAYRHKTKRRNRR